MTRRTFGRRRDWIHEMAGVGVAYLYTLRVEMQANDTPLSTLVQHTLETALIELIIATITIQTITAVIIPARPSHSPKKPWVSFSPKQIEKISTLLQER